MSKANETQIGGDHYKGAECPHCGGSLEHWDLAWLFKWDNFQYAITKYVMRWREKHGLEDLKKAKHCIEKYIEVVEADEPHPLETITKIADVGPACQHLRMEERGIHGLTGEYVKHCLDCDKNACECLGSYCRNTADEPLAHLSDTMFCEKGNAPKQERKRYRCDEDLCPGHHRRADDNCDNDPAGPASSVRPG